MLESQPENIMMVKTALSGSELGKVEIILPSSVESRINDLDFWLGIGYPSEELNKIFDIV
jgi:hypothetical protein